jgi:hypothetical protein
MFDISLIYQRIKITHTTLIINSSLVKQFELEFISYDKFQ